MSPSTCNPYLPQFVMAEGREEKELQSPNITPEHWIEDFRQLLSKNKNRALNPTNRKQLLRLSDDITDLKEYWDLMQEGLRPRRYVDTLDPANNTLTDEGADTTSDSTSVYEDASETSHSSLDDLTAHSSSNLVPPTPVDPILELLEQACAVLRKQPELQDVKKAPAPAPPTATPEKFAVELEADDPPASKSTKDMDDKDAPSTNVQVTGYEVPKSLLWRLFFAVWCLWVASIELECWVLDGLRGFGTWVR